MPARIFPALFVLLWATGFIGARYAMPFIEPFFFLTVRFLIAAALLFVLLLPAGIDWPAPRKALHAGIAGCLIHGVYLSSVFWAIRHGMPAGMSALVVGLQPLITALIARSALGEQLRPRHWIGLIAGFVGVGIVLGPKLGLGGGVNAATVSASFLAVVGISAGTVWQKRFVGAVDLKAATMIQYVAAAIFVGALSLLFEHHTVILSGELVFAMTWLVLVLSIGAVLLLMRLIRDGAVSKVSSLFYLVPAVTALLAWALFGESLTPLQLGGMAVAALGVALAMGQFGGEPDPNSTR
jgi:drug/metabolite transporter (DMT)-like permease